MIAIDKFLDEPISDMKFLFSMNEYDQLTYWAQVGSKYIAFCVKSNSFAEHTEASVLSFRKQERPTSDVNTPRIWLFKNEKRIKERLAQHDMWV